VQLQERRCSPCTVLKPGSDRLGEQCAPRGRTRGKDVADPALCVSAGTADAMTTEGIGTTQCLARGDGDIAVGEWARRTSVALVSLVALCSSRTARALWPLRAGRPRQATRAAQPAADVAAGQQLVLDVGAGDGAVLDLGAGDQGGGGRDRGSGQSGTGVDGRADRGLVASGTPWSSALRPQAGSDRFAGRSSGSGLAPAAAQGA
jgi:hypothetical protein